MSENSIFKFIRDNKFYNDNNERKMKNFVIIRLIERLFYT